MAQQHLIRAAIAFTVTTCALAVAPAVPNIADRIAAKECWSSALTGGGTYYPPKFQAQSVSTVADLFDIIYSDNFKVVISRMAKEQYVLTQCGQTAPTDAEVNKVAPTNAGDYKRKHFTVPIQNSMAMSTVLLGFIDALEVQDRVNYVDKYASAPCWQKALSCDAQIQSQNKTHLALQKNSVDVVFMDCGSDCSAVNAQPNAVHVPTTQEDDPLATAEYIKYIGAFFNKEPKANELFAAQQTAYKQAASGAPTAKLVVAWISYNAYGGPSWNQPELKVSTAAYKMELVSKVGGKNFDAAGAFANVPGVSVSDAVSGHPAAGKTYALLLKDFGGSLAKASSHFTAALTDADVVIDETYAADPSSYTFEKFLSTFGLTTTSKSKFVRNKMVLRFDRTVSASNGYDWFESRIAKPEWAVEGLAYSMNGDKSKRAKYFRNIAKGETPDQVLTKDMCKLDLPVCSQGHPAAIPLAGPVTPAPTPTPTPAPTPAPKPAPTTQSTQVSDAPPPRVVPIFVAIFAAVASGAAAA